MARAIAINFRLYLPNTKIWDTFVLESAYLYFGISIELHEWVTALEIEEELENQEESQLESQGKESVFLETTS
ncbi:hypothetical protein F7734_28935 [Scytonema sp. UIC 10036]|uniref:hypothetical protein n=1 Tax=Scytonema sp. UIC 10036 TaxID=2304196 RepID=UPI0012DA4A3A|nr:hypothetical protein [Scytonema sp. UIC 10036]MUG96149.1 hypothetical protein [Scytonema sp. UIC 10036]